MRSSSSSEAIDKEPTDKPTPPETLERIRLRLGGVLFEKKDYAAAQGQFDAVAANEKSPHRGQGLYRSAECLLAQGKNEDAKNKLAIFRDNGAFHNIAGVSDRAVLRLGHAFAGTQAVGAGPAGVPDGHRPVRQQHRVGGGRSLWRRPSRSRTRAGSTTR